jgi:hypothetical protein
MNQTTSTHTPTYLSTKRKQPEQVKVWDAHKGGDDGVMTLAQKRAYCAGLFDGDGCVQISKTHIPGRKNPTYRLCLSLDQNCPITVKFFQDVLNVKSYMYPVTRTVQHNRQMYTLKFDGSAAVQALKILRPYLVRKGVEADVAFQYWETCSVSLHPGRNGTSQEVWDLREWFFKKLKALK